MSKLAAIVSWTGEPDLLESFEKCRIVGDTALLVPPGMGTPPFCGKIIRLPSFFSKDAVLEALRWFEEGNHDYLLWGLSSAPTVTTRGLMHLSDCADDSGAGIVFSDFSERAPGGSSQAHPLVDYQPGSLRDDFDFGPLFLMNPRECADIIATIENHTINLKHGALYDLRLRLSERQSVIRLPGTLYEVPRLDDRPSGVKIFDYVDPDRRGFQLEMERVATAHLERTGAWLGRRNASLVEDNRPHPCEASVIIPVKNRAHTIEDSASSALSQETSFDFNVIVVDNHSDDGTSEVLEKLAAKNRRLVHIIPGRTDLGIGGCWNEAIYSKFCGRFAVQLDSDDLYSGPVVLQRMVDELKRGPYAMVIGSYSTVNFDLEPLPPGLVDHREWTNDNGHNNALRLPGLGAPRAFHTATLRTVGFPDVSYGEDYAVALRLSRTYPLGRVFDSVYFCRRWKGNTDAELSLETKNRYDAYKDRLRTTEITARRQMNLDSK